MYFPNSKKNGGMSILEHWESSKGAKERDEKPNWKEAPVSAMKDGGEVPEDEDHMEALATHAEEMHEAMKSGDHKRAAHAMKAFVHEHNTHEEAKKKDVDNGPVSDKKDAPNKIAGDEYD